VSCVAFSPDGVRILTASRDGTARLWETATGRAVGVMQGHTAEVNEAAFDADGARIVTASYDFSIRLWDAHDCKEIAAFKDHGGHTWQVTFCSDGTGILSASDDGARIIDAAAGREFLVIATTGKPKSVDFAPDGVTILTHSHEAVQLWSVETGREIGALDPDLSYTCARLSADGSAIATGHINGSVALWETSSLTPLIVCKGHSEMVTDVAFSPDGARLATVSLDKTVRVWDARDGTEIARLEGRPLSAEHPLPSPSNGVGFNFDGTRIIAVEEFRTMVWDAQAPFKLDLQIEIGLVREASFSPDGNFIIAAIHGGSAIMFDVKSGEQLRTFSGHASYVGTAAFSPEMGRIVTGSSDNTARIWDRERGNEIAVLQGHSGTVTSARFSPDGNLVVTASEDGTVRVWDVLDTRAVVARRSVALAAGLANGIGRRSTGELDDLLMQDAPDDLYAAACGKLQELEPNMPVWVSILRGAARPDCYRSPTQRLRAAGVDVPQSGE
jgi:WD40 repeat protein